MARCVRCLGLVLLECLAGIPASGQAVLDLGDPASMHALAARRVAMLEEARDGAARRIIAVAGAIVSTHRGATERTRLLGEALGLFDSVAGLDEEILGARVELAEARRQLVVALEGRAEAARRAADDAPPGERPALEAQARALEAELTRLHGAGAEGPGPHPFDGADQAISSLAVAVEEEGARLRAAQGLEDELRLFMGYLRSFDETGVPPTARAESGGTGEPGCPVSTCPSDLSGAPTDLPLEHARPEAGAAAGSSMGVTPASLARLRDRLRARSGRGLPPATGPQRAEGAVSRDLGVGLAMVGFRRQGESSAGVAVRSAATLRSTWSVGAASTLTVEPWVGARSVRVASVSSGEVTAEVRETLEGGREGGVRWQVASWQKGRVLSEAPPAPAYLEPGRGEGGVVARLTVPVRGGWALEAGSGADGVRYEPESWKALDRHGLNGSVALSRQGEAGSARVSLVAGWQSFPGVNGARRVDTRVGMGADWSSGGKEVLRVSLAATRNGSGLSAYDYRSGRAAVALSAPWGGGSVQGYGALSLLRYDHPGPEDRRLAPSDQDTGSMVAVQVTRPLGYSRALTVRAEWSRSVTGFGSDYYQRFGAGAQVSFRAFGAR